MKLLALIFSAALISCSQKPVQPEVPAAPPSPRLKNVEVRRQEIAKLESAPVKGKFLDYIYKIQPDHKQSGYSISSTNLGDGYAVASGPYDGWIAEFFLFRGIAKDIVIKQTSGYEVSDQDKLYGYRFEPFQFIQGRTEKLDIKVVFPLDGLASVFAGQIEKLKKDPTYDGWTFHARLRLPVKGTTSDLLVCKDTPEPPFSTQSPCVIVGAMTWTKINFRVEPAKKFVKVTETVY